VKTVPHTAQEPLRHGVVRLLQWGCWIAVVVSLAHAALAATTITVGTDPSKSVLKGRLGLVHK